MKQIITFYLALVCLSASAQNEVKQWRGNDRTGVYLEKGLLKSWNEEPKLLWHFDQLGEGYSSPVIADDKVYITGMVDNDGKIFVLDLNGKLLKETSYGEEWNKNYNGSRGTLTIDNGKIYAYSGKGNLVCFDQKSLQVLWKKNIIDDFGGENVVWGVNESPLIVGDKVIISAGGKENNILALNKNNGEKIWAFAGEGEKSAYCSPLYIGDVDVPQIVTIMAGHAYGIAASSGEKLWSVPFVNTYNIHPNTPIYDNGTLLLVSGYKKGSLMLRLKDGGKAVETVWENELMDSQIGSVVKMGNYVYGAGHRSDRKWSCIDWNTGEKKYEDSTVGECNVIAADGMLYIYNQKGQVILAKPNPEQLEKTGEFTITMGTAQHWAHPVICNGVLYVRHGDTLMAYAVK
ncbi:MAG: PQQ-binding-like beta-propeller repeat protein [Mangrovibacterium sp.]